MRRKDYGAIKVNIPIPTEITACNNYCHNKKAIQLKNTLSVEQTLTN